MKVGDLKKVIMCLHDDYEVWVNDDHQPDEISIDFESEYFTFVVKDISKKTK